MDKSKTVKGEKAMVERSKNGVKNHKSTKSKRDENKRRADAQKDENPEKLLKLALCEFPENYVPEKCEKQDKDIQDSKTKLEHFEKLFKTRLKDASTARLSKNGNETLFHVMVRLRWPKNKKQRSFLNWMLQQQEHQALLEWEDSSHVTPMHNALTFGLNHFVDAVLDVEKLNIIRILQKQYKGINCLHLAAEHSSHNLSKMINICKEDKDILMGDGKSEVGTPLHIAVQKVQVPIKEKLSNDVLNCEAEESDDQEDQHSQQGHSDFDEQSHEDYWVSGSDVDRMSSPEKYDEDGQEFDGKVYEPEPVGYTYRIETNEEQYERLSLMLNDLDKKPDGTEPPLRTQDMMPTSAQHPSNAKMENGEPEERVICTSSGSQDAFTQGLIELPPNHSVRLLVEACPEALTAKNKEERTPYQEREHALLANPAVMKAIENYVKGGDPDNDTVQKLREARAKRLIFVQDPVAYYLRSYCVRWSKSREERMKRLYKPGQEYHTEFDLLGFPKTVINDEYLNQLEIHLKFESILKYVALPALTFESQPEKGRRTKSVRSNVTQSNDHRKGRSDLIEIFKWLWGRGVREIIKVIIVEGDLPHADVAIVKALRDFRVEEWDWKRVDLCTDVISESSLAVKEVSLYSSGNNAVLMGWASEEGLGNRKKFPCLERVNLFVQEGLEDITTWDLNNKRCQGNIIMHGGKGLNGKDIDVKIIADNNPVKFFSELYTTNERIEEAPVWIKSVEKFSSFLFASSLNLEHDKNVPPVKIAIIDDGIDATLNNLQPKIAGGETFYPHPNSADLVNSYFVPRGQHGTLMARLICEICPSTQLYIARLEELPASTGNDRRVTARSAAKAVDWAISCGVKIISMSWTIQTDAREDEDMKKLEAAIRRAHEANILMFCSASDQGANSKGPCFPGDWNNCIRIGAATFTGDKLPWVEDRVDFWFPGRNVPFFSKDGKSVLYESGSSVATAAASGLAGVLIYSATLLKTRAYKEIHFQSRYKIMRAFTAMAKGADNKFPRTEEGLNKTFKQKIRQTRKSNLSNTIDIEELQWTEEIAEALELLLNYLQE